MILPLRVPLLLLVAVLATAAPASSQSDPGCSSEEPCAWVVEVDADGFVFPEGRDGWTWTEDDVVVIEVFNDDQEDHVLELPAFGVSITAAGWASDEGPYTTHETPVTLDEVGTFMFEDATAGDEAPVRVEPIPEPPAGDGTPNDGNQGPDLGDDSDERGSPGPALAVLLTVLALAAKRRRRQ